MFNIIVPMKTKIIANTPYKVLTPTKKRRQQECPLTARSSTYNERKRELKSRITKSLLNHINEFTKEEIQNFSGKNFPIQIELGAKKVNLDYTIPKDLERYAFDWQKLVFSKNQNISKVISQSAKAVFKFFMTKGLASNGSLPINRYALSEKKIKDYGKIVLSLYANCSDDCLNKNLLDDKKFELLLFFITFSYLQDDITDEKYPADISNANQFLDLIETIIDEVQNEKELDKDKFNQIELKFMSQTYHELDEFDKRLAISLVNILQDIYLSKVEGHLNQFKLWKSFLFMLKKGFNYKKIEAKHRAESSYINSQEQQLEFRYFTSACALTGCFLMLVSEHELSDTELDIRNSLFNNDGEDQEVFRVMFQIFTDIILTLHDVMSIKREFSFDVGRVEIKDPDSLFLVILNKHKKAKDQSPKKITKDARELEIESVEDLNFTERDFVNALQYICQWNKLDFMGLISGMKFIKSLTNDSPKKLAFYLRKKQLSEKDERIKDQLEFCYKIGKKVLAQHTIMMHYLQSLKDSRYRTQSDETKTTGKNQGNKRKLFPNSSNVNKKRK